MPVGFFICLEVPVYPGLNTSRPKSAANIEIPALAIMNIAKFSCRYFAILGVFQYQDIGAVFCRIHGKQIYPESRKGSTGRLAMKKAVGQKSLAG